MSSLVRPSFCCRDSFANPPLQDAHNAILSSTPYGSRRSLASHLNVLLDECYDEKLSRSGDQRAIVGRDARMRSENSGSGAPSAACASLFIRERRRSSSALHCQRRSTNSCSFKCLLGWEFNVRRRAENYVACPFYSMRHVRSNLETVPTRFDIHVVTKNRPYEAEDCGNRLSAEQFHARARERKP